MNILVTGGAGFIGSAFVRQIFEGSPGFEDFKSLTVIDSLTYSGNLDNLAPVSLDSRLKVVIANINDVSAIQEVMNNQDYVFNFAAESHVDRSIHDASNFIETNIKGTFQVLDQALKQSVNRVIHISTDEVYGSIPEGKFVESSNLEPNSPYAASKASSDLLARSFFKTHNLPVITTRCSNNYGPFQHPEKLIPLAITNLLRGRRVPVYGSGLNEREWIHVDDHCRAIAHLALFGKIGQTYNIGGSNGLKNIDLIHQIITVLGLDQSMVEFVQDRKGHDFRYAIDDSKLNQLGFRESIEFKNGIVETIKWYESNKQWWGKLVSA